MKIPTTEHAEPDIPKQRGCCLFKLFIAIALFAIALVVLAFLFQPRDVPPIDTSDLEVERIEIADADNAWIPLQAAIAEVDALKATPAAMVLLADESSDPSELLTEIEALAGPDDSAIIDALRVEVAKWEESDRSADWSWQSAHDAALPRARLAIAPLISHLEDAATRAHALVPPFSSTLDHQVPYIGDCRRTFVLVTSVAMAELRSGNPERARELAYLCLDSASHIEKSGGNLVHGLVALACKKIAFELLREIVAADGLAPADLKAAIARIQVHHSCVECMQDSLRYEFLMHKRVFDDLAAGKMPGGVSSSQRYQPFLNSGYVFQHNQSVAKVAAQFRIMIANCARNEVERESLPEQESAQSKSIFTRVMRGNVLGELFMDLLALRSVDHWVRDDEAQFGATLLILALRAHFDEHGALPATLEELVPAYLPALPPDPHDGAPFDYLPELRAIRSRLEPSASQRQDGGVLFELGF